MMKLDLGEKNCSFLWTEEQACHPSYRGASARSLECCVQDQRGYPLQSSSSWLADGFLWMSAPRVTATKYVSSTQSS